MITDRKDPIQCLNVLPGKALDDLLDFIVVSGRPVSDSEAETLETSLTLATLSLHRRAS